MPKVVDAAQRRREIAEAVFRVIERSGLAEVTLARVAAEAGLAVGSVRHYVGSHNDLLRHTLHTLAGDVSARVDERGRRVLASGIPTDPDRRRTELVEILGEVLPLDARRHTEAVVWIAFGEAARVDPDLQPAMLQVYDRLRMLARGVLDRIRPAGVGGDNAVDAHRLAALLNGLSLDAVQAPQRTTPVLIRRLLRRELDALLDGPGRDCS